MGTGIYRASTITVDSSSSWVRVIVWGATWQKDLVSISRHVTKCTHQSILKELFRITFPFTDNILLGTFICLIKSEPELTEVKLFDETLADVAPLCVGAT